MNSTFFDRHRVFQPPREPAPRAHAEPGCDGLSALEVDYLKAHNWKPVEDDEAGRLWLDPRSGQWSASRYEGSTALRIQRRREAVCAMNRDRGAL